jgi:hypothetical protein
MSNTTTANIPADLEKGEDVIVTFADGSTIEGTWVSINSKGVNVHVDGKLVTRSLARVASVDRPTDEAEDEATEGMTTAELADMFETSARALRVRLRKLGLGVGRGKRYNLTDAELAIVRASVEGEPIEE